MPDWPRSRDESLQFLVERINYEQTRSIPYHPEYLKLSRMRQLLSAVGDPHHNLRTVHIAGTKGKGSTATMLAAAASRAGYRTGLYTSPHIERIEERFVIDGQICTSDQFVDLVRAIVPAVQQMDSHENGPTYFEICTALAFLWFAQEQVDLAVIEVGMGGRLDSTNVCQPILTLITSISLDHTQQLGTTLPAIAREKGGIIKPGVPLISGVEDASASREIALIAAERGSPLCQYGVDYRWHLVEPPSVSQAVAQPVAQAPMTVVLSTRGAPEQQWPDIVVGMEGVHQRANAALAVVACHMLRSAGFTIPEETLRATLRQTHCPARIERFSSAPRLILDAAHNVASIEALINVLRSYSVAGQKYLLFAAAQGKDVRGMLELLVGYFDRLVLTEFQSNPRHVPVQDLVTILQSLPAHQASEVHWECRVPAPAAWQHLASVAASQDLICVTGSFFLAAELRPLLREYSPPCDSGPP